VVELRNAERTLENHDTQAVLVENKKSPSDLNFEGLISGVQQAQRDMMDTKTVFLASGCKRKLNSVNLLKSAFDQHFAAERAQLLKNISHENHAGINKVLDFVHAEAKKITKAFPKFIPTLFVLRAFKSEEPPGVSPDEWHHDAMYAPGPGCLTVIRTFCGPSTEYPLNADGTLKDMQSDSTTEGVLQPGNGWTAIHAMGYENRRGAYHRRPGVAVGVVRIAFVIELMPR